jgi:GAF domain-containing protein
MAAKKKASSIKERSNAEFAAELHRIAAERDEALARERALTEVLRVINSSPGDLAPVFDELLDRTMRLCRAAFGVLFRYDGTAMHSAAMRGDMLDEAATEWFRTWVPEPDSAVGQVLKGAPFLHIEDVRDTEVYRSGVPSRVKMIDATGARTAMWVGLRHDNRLLGVIVIYRLEVRPFADAEIALVRSFADQAVIAMENARLLTETRQALAQQTATAEVLEVINASPGDLAPIFDAILEKAMALCDVAYGDLELYDGDTFQAVATRGLTDAFDEQVRRGYPAGDNPATRPLIAGERVSHIVNMAEVDFSKVFTHEPMEHEGHHTLLCVPLRRENHLLGMIACARGEVRAFSEKEIALLENFAAQAVIAMENARLISETREALEQQTATAEVLGVINAHPGDLGPVFEAILGKAMRLCAASFGVMALYDGEYLRATAMCGVPPALVEFMSQPQQPTPSNAFYRLVEGEDLVQIDDVTDSDAYRSGSPLRRALVNLGGARTALWVALRNDEKLLGDFVLYRQAVRPFTDKQIALLKNFAAQAVIAMENARRPMSPNCSASNSGARCGTDGTSCILPSRGRRRFGN